MSKTVPLQEDVHALIVDKQKDLKKRRNITVRISDLLAMYVKDGIERKEKLLGLIEDKEDIKEGVNKEKDGNVTDGNVANVKKDME